MFLISQLLFNTACLGNPLKYWHRPYISRNQSHWATSSSLKM